jgi:hypothetical protein
MLCFLKVLTNLSVQKALVLYVLPHRTVCSGKDCSKSLQSKELAHVYHSRQIKIRSYFESGVFRESEFSSRNHSISLYV